MKKISTALAALGIAAAAALAAPATAHAAPPAPAAGPAKSATLPNGYLYVWEEANRGGPVCAWPQYDSRDWSTCSMRNKASALENRGWPGAYEDVDLFWGTSYSGSHICLPNATYLANLSSVYFPRDGKSGQGQSTNNNISSHRWSNNC
ncbi:hypothetical protein [Streptomyces griseoluteus]|uniref:hypothetical protein n=1 Tax=Streptomyces griseoluteus TaxID=29306 RepID=UPI0036F8CA10